MFEDMEIRGIFLSRSNRTIKYIRDRADVLEIHDGGR